MRAIAVFRRLTRGITRQGRRALRLLMAGLTALGDRLSYRRQELIAVGLLATTVLGGFAVESWRTRSSALFDRFEAEPPRLGATAHRTAPRGVPRGLDAARSGLTPTPHAPLDLNQASEVDLMQLPGIGPRLAARIVAQREALGGRFASRDDLGHVPGIGRTRLAALRPLVTVEASARTRVSDTDQTDEPP